MTVHIQIREDNPSRAVCAWSRGDIQRLDDAAQCDTEIVYGVVRCMRRTRVGVCLSVAVGCFSGGFVIFQQQKVVSYGTVTVNHDEAFA